MVLLVSPSLRQSSELFRKVKDFMALLPHPPELDEENKLSLEFANGSRIVSLPSSEGTIRGFSGVTLLIEDEASRVPDALHNAVRPMLAVSGGAMVLMSTPFGRRGHFFEAWENGKDAWERIEVDATQCPRISPTFLANEKRTLGDWWYDQEYGCQFRDATDSVFPYEVVMRAKVEDAALIAI